MGKSLIIKGADFSENGIKETVITDVTEYAEATGAFRPGESVGAYNSIATSSSDTRCAILRLSIPSLVTAISKYSKMKIDIKTGFDYVLGIQRKSGGTWHQMNGSNESGTQFTWVTSNQHIEVPTSQFMLITGNIRHDDDTTTFDNTTKLSDVMTITLSNEE